MTIQGPSILVRKKFGENVRRRGQLLRRHDLERLDRRGDDGQPLHRAARAEERGRRLPARQDDLRGQRARPATRTTTRPTRCRSGYRQDMFGDLTTVSIGFSRGWDTVGKRDEPDFQRTSTGATTASASSQVLTRNLLLSLNFETITEEGYLQNPYRTMRYVRARGRLLHARAGDLPDDAHRQRRRRSSSSTTCRGAPRSRASTASTPTPGASTRTTAGVEYTQPMWGKWVLHGLVPLLHAERRRFLQRPVPARELTRTSWCATRKTPPTSSHTLGVGASYEFPVTWLSWLKTRHGQPAVQPDDARLRRLPGPARITRRAPRSPAPSRSTRSTPTSSSSSCRSGSDAPRGLLIGGCSPFE